MSTKHPARATAVVSPRRRKLRITFAGLGFCAAVSICIASVAYWRGRPAKYNPGEASEDVRNDLERKLPANAPVPKFVDVTESSGLARFRNFAGDRSSQLPEDMGPGLAWGDFDRDGDDDLFLASAGGALNVPDEKLLPCELYESNGDGTFIRSSAFPELRIRGMGAAWGDVDSDGDLDLAVSAYNGLFLFRNELNGSVRRFRQDRSFLNPQGFWSGLSWADFDNDRDLDLYVCGYVQFVVEEGRVAQSSDQAGVFVPYTLNPASYQPALNMLLRNDGGTFTDVARELDVTNPTGRSLSALWHDFDDDGWIDLYIANDISDNVFYRNTGGKFQDISHAAWVADYRSAMGLAAGDYNRDGDDDLFITHWVAQENALYENHWADFNRKGSTNAYPLRFTDVNEMRGLGPPSLSMVGWGTEFIDFDSDGWLDIVAANGSTLEVHDSNPKILQPQPPFLFWNDKGAFFHDLAPWCAAVNEPRVSRGLAVSDYDNDGDLDFAVAQLGAGVQLFRNDTESRNTIEFVLKSGSSGFGDGTRLVAHAGDAMHRRTVSSASYLSQSSRTVHIGLGDQSVVDRLEVRWLGGGTNVYEQLTANSRYELVEGDPTPREILLNRRGTSSNKQRLTLFWETQRAAMNALKVEKDFGKAARLFRRALAIDPRHEDSRYYLSTCLTATGQIERALGELKTLQTINPQSHRAFQQWGNLRAQFATTPRHLLEAETSLLRARALNPEETGALLILGEVVLLKGDLALAESHLAAACVTNPRAFGGFFLRGYIAWRKGDEAQARSFLQQTRTALGKEWQPKGATAEGDVRDQQHAETSPLRRFYENWSGSETPSEAFTALQSYLGGRLAL